MENLFQVRNRILIITVLLGVLGFSSLIFVNNIFAISFLCGNLISLGYLWHLTRSVSKISEGNKSVNTISRLALSIGFMLLIGHILSLNLVFIVIGFLSNHLSLLINLGYMLLRNRAGT